MGEHPGRDGAAGGPFADYDQHPRIGGRDLRIPARLYRGHQPARRFARARSPCRDGARLQRPRQRADRPEGHRDPRAYADGDRRGGVGRRAHEDQGARVRAAAEHLRRTARQHAGAVRAAGDQYRTAAGGAAGIHAESLRKPRIPDGRRGPEIQQARSPHRDQPRQGQPAGRQHAQYRADAPVRTQRPASGLLLHERQAVRDTGRDQPPAAQQARRPEVDLCAQRQGRDDPARQPHHARRERRAAPALSLQPFSVGYGFGRTGEGEDHRAGA